MPRGLLHFGLSALLLGSLAACAGFPTAPGPDRGATIRFRTGLPAYAVAAAIGPYTASDVGRVLIKLYTVEGQSVLPAMGKKAQGDDVLLMQPVDNDGSGFQGVELAFSNLKRDTTYRLVAEAYAPGDTAYAHPLQVQDGSCQNDVRVGHDDQEVVEDVAHVSPIVVPIKLIDKRIGARETSAQGIAITGGTLIHVPNATEN